MMMSSCMNPNRVGLGFRASGSVMSVLGVERGLG